MIKRVEWNRKTASVFAVAAALIIVLVVALNPRGIKIAENTTLDPVEWTFQRPNESVDILDKLNATYASDELSANMYILMTHYQNSSIVHDDNDYLRMVMAVNATTSNPNGYIESLYVTFTKDSQPSFVSWLHTYFSLENLSLLVVSDGLTFGGYKEAYVELAGVNSTDSIYFRATAEWSLLTPNIQSHQMEIAFEITYYNGTAYNKIVQPFQLNIVGRGET
jgi:hypothetical protein